MYALGSNYDRHDHIIRLRLDSSFDCPIPLTLAVHAFLMCTCKDTIANFAALMAVASRAPLSQALIEHCSPLVQQQEQQTSPLLPSPSGQQPEKLQLPHPTINLLKLHSGSLDTHAAAAAAAAFVPATPALGTTTPTTPATAASANTFPAASAEAAHAPTFAKTASPGPAPVPVVEHPSAAPAADYPGTAQNLRVSVKLEDATPARLPPGLLSDIAAAMQSSPDALPHMQASSASGPPRCSVHQELARGAPDTAVVRGATAATSSASNLAGRSVHPAGRFVTKVSPVPPLHNKLRCLQCVRTSSTAETKG